MSQDFAICAGPGYGDSKYDPMCGRCGSNCCECCKACGASPFDLCDCDLSIDQLTDHAPIPARPRPVSTRGVK
jgi:hypothetical protein